MGDSVFSTNNDVLIRCYKPLPAINCVQHKAEKKIVTEENIIQSNFNGFGNSVGSITNRATAMFSVQAGYSKDSKEYKELEYRIICTQKYQQDELDKLKGIVATPMPKYWYDFRACKGNDYQKSICCEKKPYFMIYRYDEERKKYREFIKQHDMQCTMDFKVNIETLLKTPQDQLTQEQKQAIHWFNVFNPVDMGMCTINKICFYIEDKVGEYKSQLKERDFDWEQFKVKRRCTQEHKERLKELMEVFVSRLKHCTETNTDFIGIKSFSDEYFQERAREICPNDDERRDIVLDLCYGDNHNKSNKDFCGTIIADMVLKEKMNEQADI